MEIVKEQNLKILEDDEQTQSAISHGFPSILTWTNTIQCNAHCSMRHICRDKPLPERNSSPSL